MSKTILYIHQSAELYGSDKTLFYLAKEVNEQPDFNVIVVLPNNGPLKDLLENNNIKVIISSVIKVSRKMFTIKNILLLPFHIISSIKRLKKALNNTQVDVIHSNTLAVLVGAFYSKRHKIKHIWHVHEIIKKPKIVSAFYPLLVDKFSDVVVYNSKASKDFLCNKRAALNKKSKIILNGFDREFDLTTPLEIEKVRTNLFNVEKLDIVLGLVGRINKWKGQQLLLKSFLNLKNEFPNLKLMFIGSAPPNQDYLVEELQQNIKDYNLVKDCKIIPFQKNIWTIWDSIDIAVVPSTEPEPFGLVAVEAMLAKKPVVAANHGGLVEIVVQDETGYLFKPNDHVELESSIKKLLNNQSELERFSQNGYKRAINEFSLQNHINDFIKLYKTVTS